MVSSYALVSVMLRKGGLRSFLTFGKYDMVVLAFAPNHAEAREVIEGIKSTETLVGI